MTKLEEKIIKTQLKEKYGDEQVFVVPFNDVPRCITKETQFISCSDNIFASITKVGFFKLRGEVEMNPDYKQIITYAVITNNDKYLATKRLKGDERLRSQISLGVGGHISPEDYSDISIEFISNALKREMKEEIDISAATDMDISFLGLINDNSIEVSQDHLGLVFNIEIKSIQPIKIKETEKLEAIFMSRNEVINKYKSLENWSKIYADAVIGNWGL